MLVLEQVVLMARGGPSMPIPTLVLVCMARGGLSIPPLQVVLEQVAMAKGLRGTGTCRWPGGWL